MPRKQRIAKLRAETPLSPAVAYRLMSGRWAEARMHGWAEAAALIGSAEARHLAAAWAAHRDALVAEAEASGFVPYAVSHQQPRGPGFDTWADRYLRDHRY
jgi:hypothetical protein